MALWLELRERVEEVRHAETVRRPAGEVPVEGVEVGAVVRKPGSESHDAVTDRVDEDRRDGMRGGIGHAAVLHLQRLKRRRRRLQLEPGGLEGRVYGVLDDLGFPDDGADSQRAGDFRHG